MIGLTFCSGIGAPEAAAPWVDWRLAAEIEAFPRAVLRQRFGYCLPGDHNQGDPLLWGDMTEVTPELLRARGVPLPNIIVAGTPCQAFSVAGLRQGTADARGNLTLKLVEITHAIVDARDDGQLILLWENVPGVLSDATNAFGCFLGGLVGAVDAVLPSPKPRDGKSTGHWKWHPGGRFEVRDDEGEPTGEFVTVPPGHRLSWPSEGMVEGPRARAAWCVLDAQWFGVAQRRRRVFVVVDFGGACDPAAVILEPDRLRGDSAPRRGPGENPAPTIAARTRGGGGLGTDFDCDGGLIPEVCNAIAARDHKQPRAEDGVGIIAVAHSLRAEGFDASEDGTGRGTPLVPVAMPLTAGMSKSAARMPHEQGALVPVAYGVTTEQTPKFAPDVALTLTKQSPTGGGQPQAVAFAFDLRGRDGGAMPEGPHDTANIRAADGGSSRSHLAQPVAYRTTGNDGAYETGDVVGALQTGTDPFASVLAFQDRFRGDDGRGYDRAPPAQEDVTGSLETVKPWHVAFDCKGSEVATSTDGSAPTLRSMSHAGSHANGGGRLAVAPGWAVRRLTPVECERLQGFPDGHTAIEVRGKPAADGPRYKALGNSMAVPVVRWIMDRIRVSAATEQGKGDR